jgi:CheY-like chemotaxis protein
MGTQKMKIILVDDDDDDRQFFAEAFEELQLDASLLLLEDGLKLLDHLEQADHHFGTHIFLDLNMPILSGMDCLKKLREFTGTNNPFVTIYSTSTLPADIKEAYENGANGYLPKPSSFAKLKESLHKAILSGITNNNPVH